VFFYKGIIDWHQGRIGVESIKGEGTDIDL
jgi:hypothetical protein